MADVYMFLSMYVCMRTYLREFAVAAVRCWTWWSNKKLHMSLYLHPDLLASALGACTHRPSTEQDRRFMFTHSVYSLVGSTAWLPPRCAKLDLLVAGAKSQSG